MSAAAADQLGSVSRGTQEFVEFVHEVVDDAVNGRVPIVLYDHLGKPTRSMLEDHLADAKGGQTAVCFASGMATINASVGVTMKARDEIGAHHKDWHKVCLYPMYNLVTLN